MLNIINKSFRDIHNSTNCVLFSSTHLVTSWHILSTLPWTCWHPRYYLLSQLMLLHAQLWTIIVIVSMPMEGLTRKPRGYQESHTLLTIVHGARIAKAKMHIMLVVGTINYLYGRDCFIEGLKAFIIVWSSNVQDKSVWSPSTPSAGNVLLKACYRFFPPLGRSILSVF